MGWGTAGPDLGIMDMSTGLGEPLEAPLHLFSDISLDVDTHRTGKVRRAQGDKVRLSWLPQDSRVNRQT